MMDITEKVQEWLEKARERFFALDLNGLDEALTPAEQAEWDNIYASFRSGFRQNAHNPCPSQHMVYRSGTFICKE